ncbi:MAG: hypothetical protein HY328_17080, partial [Chloroflexi bacterium]|nr:hypothetical protein [Chloroflexota bacterium]
MTTLQSRLMLLVFIGFGIVSLGLTLAIYWGGAVSPDTDISADRDIAVVLEQVAGEKIEASTDASGQLLAVIPGSAQAGGQESNLPLPDGSYLSDFELDVDAFNFRNYGSTFPEGNLTIAEIYEIFGEGVCLRVENGVCTPTPAAQIWIDQMNGVMGQGHCLGFTVLAYDLFRGNLSTERFASQADIVNQLAQDVSVMRTLAQRWSLQTTPELLRASVVGTPRDIIIKLYELKEPVDLGIFGRKGGGHSMLAYGVENQGDGVYHILVYDNNWPNQKVFVEVDTNSNTWQYALSGENPAEVPAIWEGDAETRTLIFIPLSAYEQPVTCPFCPDRARASAKAGLAMLQPATGGGEFVVVALSGEEGNLQVSSPEGGRLGQFDGQFVNEIADALAVRPRSALYNNGEPILYLPKNQEFSVQVQPREGVAQGSASLRMIGPDIAVAIDNLTITPGQQEQFTFSPDSRQIGYIPSGGQTPTIQFAYFQGDASYLAVLSGVELQAGQEFGLGADGESGEFFVESAGGSEQPLTLVLSKIDGKGSSQFASNSLALAGNGALALDVQAWQENSSLTVTVDEDGNGAPDRTEEVADQPISELLSQPFQPEQVRQMLGQSAAFLAPQEAAALGQSLLEAIADGAVSGAEAGQLLFDLGHLGMDSQELAAFVQAGEMPVEEQAALLFNLYVDENQQQEIVAAAFPNPAQQIAVTAQLERLETARTVINEFEFTGQPPENFAQYVAGQNLSPDVQDALARVGNVPGSVGAGGQVIASAQSNDTPTDTPVPPTDTPQPTETPVPTDTPVPPTNTPVPPTNTPVPPTNTPRPTNTPVPPTNTPVPPTNTPRPTNTPVPPTNTPRPTNTPVPPTNTPRPTNTPVPPTNTPVPPT